MHNAVWRMAAIPWWKSAPPSGADVRRARDEMHPSMSPRVVMGFFVAAALRASSVFLNGLAGRLGKSQVTSFRFRCTRFSGLRLAG